MVTRESGREVEKHPNTLTPDTSVDGEGNGLESNQDPVFPSPLETPKDKKLLLEFKIRKCHKDVCTNRIACWYYHGFSDRRRAPHFNPTSGFSYTNIKCPRECKVLNCKFALTTVEQIYHPTIYKTKLCNAYPQCETQMCTFAHDTKELRRPEEMYSIRRSKTNINADIPQADEQEDGVQSEQLQAMEAEKSALEAHLAKIQQQAAEKERKLKCKACCEAKWVGVKPCCGGVICLACSKDPQCRMCAANNQEVVFLTLSPS